MTTHKACPTPSIFCLIIIFFLWFRELNLHPRGQCSVYLFTFLQPFFTFILTEGLTKLLRLDPNL